MFYLQVAYIEPHSGTGSSVLSTTKRPPSPCLSDPYELVYGSLAGYDAGHDKNGDEDGAPACPPKRR